MGLRSLLTRLVNSFKQSPTDSLWSFNRLRLRPWRATTQCASTLILGDVDQLLFEFNHERARYGAPKLTLNQQLCRSAQTLVDYLVFTRQLSHVGPGDATVIGRITQAGYRLAAVGEDIAEGFADVASVMHAWIASTPHHRIMVGGDYADVGFGVGTTNDGIKFWVADLARSWDGGLAVGHVVPSLSGPLRKA